VPAIQPAVLRQQSALLAEHFDNPPAYIRSLHYLLDFYSDRARRPGQSGIPAPIITAYQVRPPVLRMILQELTPLAVEQPETALSLCDALWAEDYLEFRQLAAMLLGQIPPQPPDVIIGRVKSWLTPDLEFYLIEAVMNFALPGLRQEHPKSMIQLIEEWLESPKPVYQQLGLRALLPLINLPDFENVPVFFRLLQPLTCSITSGLRPDLLDVLRALAHRSPQETAYFLRQTLTRPEAKDTPWIIRQLLDEFPPQTQESLRNAVKEA
jgi:hypothetical protein